VRPEFVQRTIEALTGFGTQRRYEMDSYLAAMLTTAPNVFESDGVRCPDRTTAPEISVPALGWLFLAELVSCPFIAMCCATGGSGCESRGRMEEFLYTTSARFVERKVLK
jgi:hypothetical protein